MIISAIVRSMLPVSLLGMPSIHSEFHITPTLRTLRLPNSREPDSSQQMQEL
ncbi:hypothetical protein PSHT_01981 [Puccinia striiformis]|uniref:Uncharacterized protein n=2 Tax=Puccinia striiformis TaxID=27350 RepID=A0A2S4ULU7_9BASI|nr:hypothetical protein PSTT_14539 [Puccinia striiformis]POW21833.1 hypothetical protein PSHT_01981 [Puccinia striiformis]